VRGSDGSAEPDADTPRDRLRELAAKKEGLATQRIDGLGFSLDNTSMSIGIETSGSDPQVRADIDALTRHHMERTPLDPELVQRVRERAARITEDLRRRGAEIDIDQLFDDDA
jgi:hypothetical protein